MELVTVITYNVKLKERARSWRICVTEDMYNARN